MSRPTLSRSAVPFPRSGAVRRPHRRTDHAWSATPPRDVTRTPLDATRLCALRVTLEAQRDFRIEQLAQLDRQRRPGPLSSAHREIYVSLAVGARTALHEAEAALWRMAEGRYGVCTTCGSTLDPARLETVPQTARCAPCQHAAQAVDRA